MFPRARKQIPGRQAAIFLPRVALARLGRLDSDCYRVYVHICALHDGRLTGGPLRLSRWAQLTTFKVIAALDVLIQAELVTQVPASGPKQNHPYDYIVTDWLDPATYENLPDSAHAQFRQRPCDRPQAT